MYSRSIKTLPLDVRKPNLTLVVKSVILRGLLDRAQREILLSKISLVSDHENIYLNNIFFALPIKKKKKTNINTLKIDVRLLNCELTFILITKKIKKTKNEKSQIHIKYNWCGKTMESL